jgi:hypothetical protein
MKILSGVADCGVREANFESLRLVLNYIGEQYSPAYFHGIAGTVFRAGGICPCAPTCTMAMSLQQLIKLLGYDYEELPFNESSGEADFERMLQAVCASVDNGVPALVWNAFAPCEWGIVTGYDDAEKIFYGRVPWRDGVACATDEYEKGPWDKAKEEAGLVGLLAVIIKDKTGALNRREAEMSALKEAVRHANDPENTDKINSSEWVFLQGKAALNRWADDFLKPEKERGAGDSYCLDIYSSCHARAGEFLREIAGNYPSAARSLKESAQYFDKEAECLQKLFPLLTWSSPWGADADRNIKAYPLLKEASENYNKAVDMLEAALVHIQ